MDDDKLMKLVEERDVLYNRFHPYYKDVNKKEEAYAEIAEELDIPGNKWNKCLKNLRLCNLVLLCNRCPTYYKTLSQSARSLYTL